LIENQG